LTAEAGLNDPEGCVTIESTEKGAKVVLKVIGRMDAGQAKAFEDACTAWVNLGRKCLIIDMSELAYVSSMGLRSFVSIGKLLQEKGGTLRLSAVTGLVKQVFEITRLTSVFPMHDTVEAALAEA
jgi:anti-anti-sigma factor